MQGIKFKLDIDDNKYIYEQPNGRFRVEIPLGYNRVNGKRERFVKRCATKDEAIQIRNEQLREISNGNISADSCSTFQEIAVIYVAGDYRKKKLAETTKESYNGILERYLYPLADIPINKLTVEHLEELYEYLGNDYEGKDGEPLEPTTVGHVHALIRAILNFARKNLRIINYNVAEMVIDPPTVDCEERECYNLREITKIFELIKKENLRFRALVQVALTGCLRRGEIAGLNWEDIDEIDRVIAINTSACVLKGKGIVIKEPKNKASKDKVSVTQDTINALVAYREELEQLGFEITPTTPVFLSERGTRLSPNTLSKLWKNFRNDNDIPKYSFHALRHSGLSLLYAITKDIVKVSKHARHSQVSTTTDIYLHSDIEADKEITTALEYALDNPQAPTMQDNIIKKQEELIERLQHYIEEFKALEMVS